jgi:hypothetical protein
VTASGWPPTTPTVTRRSRQATPGARRPEPASADGVWDQDG